MVEFIETTVCSVVGHFEQPTIAELEFLSYNGLVFIFDLIRKIRLWWTPPAPKPGDEMYPIACLINYIVDEEYAMYVGPKKAFKKRLRFWRMMNSNSNRTVVKGTGLMIGYLIGLKEISVEEADAMVQKAIDEGHEIRRLTKERNPPSEK